MPIREKNGKVYFLRSLTDEQEQEIARLYVETEISISDIAKRFNVSVSSVKRICEKHEIGGSRRPRLSETIKADILSEVMDGRTPAGVAEEYGVDTKTVYNLVNAAGGRKWLEKMSAYKSTGVSK